MLESSAEIGKRGAHPTSCNDRQNEAPTSIEASARHEDHGMASPSNTDGGEEKLDSAAGEQPANDASSKRRETPCQYFDSNSIGASEHHDEDDNSDRHCRLSTGTLRLFSNLILQNNWDWLCTIMKFATELAGR